MRLAALALFSMHAVYCTVRKFSRGACRRVPFRPFLCVNQDCGLHPHPFPPSDKKKGKEKKRRQKLPPDPQDPFRRTLTAHASSSSIHSHGHSLPTTGLPPRTGGELRRHILACLRTLRTSFESGSGSARLVRWPTTNFLNGSERRSLRQTPVMAALR